MFYLTLSQKTDHCGGRGALSREHQKSFLASIFLLGDPCLNSYYKMSERGIANSLSGIFTFNLGDLKPGKPHFPKTLINPVASTIKSLHCYKCYHVVTG
jgi:hypothetical protein